MIDGFCGSVSAVFAITVLAFVAITVLCYIAHYIDRVIHDRRKRRILRKKLDDVIERGTR